jgi:hypothetical protein
MDLKGKTLDEVSNEFAYGHSYRIPDFISRGDQVFYDHTDFLAAKDGFKEGFRCGYNYRKRKSEDVERINKIIKELTSLEKECSKNTFDKIIKIIKMFDFDPYPTNHSFRITEYIDVKDYETDRVQE